MILKLFTYKTIIVRLIISLACIFQITKAQNVGVIIDRSLSVDENNRNEAVEIIIDLLNGKATSNNSHNWVLLPEKNQLQSPEQIQLREQKQNEVFSILNNTNAKALANPPFQLLIGHFGDLSTVHKLSKESWQRAGQNFPNIIRTKAQDASPSDPRTHFELAKATVSEKINKNQEFYLFVISDGVEDLENWPVKYYLDPKKLTNLEALSRGDYRDAGKARHLRSLNTKHYKKYSHSDRKKLKDFKHGYSELLIGRLSLNAQELETFFINQPNKVPVFAYLYYFKPRPKLDPSFLIPIRTSPSSPYKISKTSSTINWQLSSDSKAKFENNKVQLTLYSDDDTIIGNKDLTGKTQTSISELFPELEDGIYRALLTFTNDNDKKEILCHLEMSNYAPSIQFTGSFATATPLDTVNFTRDHEIAPLEQEITWEYIAQGEKTRAPKTVIKKISHYEPSSDLRDTFIDEESPLKGKLKSAIETSPNIKEILAANEDSEFNESPLPLGGGYKLTLEAIWSSGERSSATTYFTLPTPELFLLGNNARESEEKPRIAKKDELVKIANWTHGWKDFSYELEAEILNEDSWDYLPNNDSNPLQLVDLDNGIAVKVTKNIDSPIRYRVKFLPDEETGLAEIIDEEVMSTQDGYIITEGISWLPIIFIISILITLSFIAFHFFKKK